MRNDPKRSAPPGQFHEPDPVSFFASTYALFESASQKAGTLDKFYNIQGHLIRLSFAGPALTCITPALEHWAVEPDGEPELTIRLWDDASTQTNMPPPAWLGYGAQTSDGQTQGVYAKRGEIRGYNTARMRTAFQWGSDVLSVLDIAQKQAIYWTRDAAKLPQWEIGSPLRTILHWWLRLHGLQLVHAAAVGTASSGVLLAGKGGSGKSTTALTCLDAGLTYVSDDYCLVAAEPSPYAYNLYNTGKVREDNLHRVPHLAPLIENVEKATEDKWLFFLDKEHAEKLGKGFPLKAVLVPRVTGKQETSFTPAPATAGLSALTLSTMAQLPGSGPEALQIIQQLFKQLPCYYLDLGTDLTQIPQAILKLLNE